MSYKFTFTVFLLIFLSFNCVQGFKKHQHKRVQQFTKAQQFLIDALGPKHEVSFPECIGVSVLQCVQNDLDESNDQYFADQIASLSKFIEQNAENYEILLEKLMTLELDEKTGQFYNCLAESMLCGTEFVQNYQQQPKLSLTLKSQNKSNKSEIFAKSHQLAVKQAEHNLQVQLNEKQISCIVLNIVKTIQQLPQENDIDVVQNIMELTNQIGDQMDDSSNENAAQLSMQDFSKLACDQKTGTFWKGLASGSAQCVGVNLPIDKIPCPKK